MRVFLGFIITFAVAAISFSLSLQYRYRPVVDEVCTIVIENYFDSFPLENFAKECELTKIQFPKYADAKEATRQINGLLATLNTSHLTLYEPDENVKMWLHESLDNGIRCRDVQGFVIVSEVLSKSPAEKAHFKLGDEILTIDDRQVHVCSEVFGRSGTFSIVRGEHTAQIKVVAEKYEEDESLQVTDLGEGVGLLRVKSFLSPFFSYDQLAAIHKQLFAYSEVIIDLRANIGGSFPAMLRLLSLFTCEPEFVGKLLVSSRHENEEEYLKDNLESESQLEQIARVRKLKLQTHGEQMCIKNHISLVIDHQTSSVSEIFADHLKRAHGAVVYGQQSAGEVVMAKWFALSTMNQYSLSVPIADFENARSMKLEALGVRPDIFLQEDLEVALKGRDSWIDQILKMRHKHLSNR